MSLPWQKIKCLMKYITCSIKCFKRNLRNTDWNSDLARIKDMIAGDDIRWLANKTNISSLLWRTENCWHLIKLVLAIEPSSRLEFYTDWRRRKKKKYLFVNIWNYEISGLNFYNLYVHNSDISFAHHRCIWAKNFKIHKR